MVCSVRQGDGTYRYYEVAGQPRPAGRRQLGALGLGIRDALPQLPFGARQVGSGWRARGVVCRGGIGLGALEGTDSPAADMLAFVGVVGGLWLLTHFFLPR